MSESRRKLIFFWPYVEWGGAQIYVLAIVKEALPNWNVTVVLPRASSAELIGFIEQAGAQIEFLDFQADLAEAQTIRRKLQRHVRRVTVEIASFRYLLRHRLRDSILHIDFPPWQSWIFFAALSLRGANVFMTMHNALPNKPAWRVPIWKMRLQFVSRLRGFHILTSNKDTKDRLRGWVESKFWENIKVTYTCVNPPEIQRVLTSSFSKNEVREKHGIGASSFVVLCVGQFVDRKGRWVFLEAAKIVAADHRDVEFVWLAPKLPSEIEQARIDSYNLDARFRIVLSESVGSTHEDVLRFFRIADTFALPSFVEGLPIALLEAMALEVPSISTNVYAIPEACKHMETGIIIDAGDARTLADAVVQLKLDAQLRARLAKHGSSFVLANFDERVASSIALAAYEGCFQDGG
ncbi:MAG: glycosyltransferase family 4 protein [Pyrinomonadaceae bacterium]